MPSAHGPISLHSDLICLMASFQHELSFFSTSMGSVMASLQGAQPASSMEFMPASLMSNLIPCPHPSSSTGFSHTLFLEPHPSSGSLPVVPTKPSYASVATTRPSLPNDSIPQVNPNPNLEASTSNARRLHYKLIHLRTAWEKGNQVCYRCGDSGHLASSCRNFLVCFTCG
jgi:Zinc knuckle